MEHFKSQRKDDKEARQEANEFAIQQTEQIQKLLAGNEEGMKAIDGITGYNNDTFDPDPYKSAYKAGKRAVSVILRAMLNRDVKKATEQLEQEKEK